MKKHGFQKPGMVGVGVALGLALVGALDYWTGLEVLIFPLYFLPLFAGARVFRQALTLLFHCLLAAFIWAVALHQAGNIYGHVLIWVINLITHFIAFAFFSLMVLRLQRSLEREKLLSLSDWLTGLPNSRAFREEASALLSLCHRKHLPVTLAYVDLDHFKAVNDTLGHAEGDGVLRKVAEAMKYGLRTSDIVARVGGDEFVIFMGETSGSAAVATLEKLRMHIRQIRAGGESPLSASIGAVSYVQAPSDLEIMIKAADDLMYQVKADRRDGISLKELPAAAG